MLLLFNSACSVSPPKTATTLPPADPSVAELKTTVARVNGKEITRTELNQAKKIILANKPGLQIPPLLQKEFEMQALNQLINTELLFQASQKLEIKDLDKQAEDKLAEIKKRFPDPKDYARELQKIGVDEKGRFRSPAGRFERRGGDLVWLPYNQAGRPEKSRDDTAVGSQTQDRKLPPGSKDQCGYRNFCRRGAQERQNRRVVVRREHGMRTIGLLPVF